MERVVTAHRQLRCILWVAEAAIVAICLITAYQIGMEAKGSTIWACAPILIIAVMETTRVPLAGWTAHLKPFAMLCGFAIMGTIAVLTFEGMSMGVERFIHQRVMDVLAARDVLDAERAKAHDAESLVAKQTAEVEKRRKLVAELQGERPTAHVSAPPATCHGLYKGKPVTYACPNKADDRDSETARRAQEAFDARVAGRNASLAEAEAELKKLQSADGLTAGDAVIAAEKAVQAAAANSTMYRTAATWYGVPVKDLTDAQFERFKRIAVAALAGAVAVGTMMLAFISHAQPRLPGQGSKVVRAIRAYYARKRKNVVRTVFKDRPVEKIIEKLIDVPGPERIVVKHIHVPIDAASGRVVNTDGSLGETLGLRTVQGGKQ
jgi:hypothetical protein